MLVEEGVEEPDSLRFVAVGVDQDDASRSRRFPLGKPGVAADGDKMEAAEFFDQPPVRDEARKTEKGGGGQACFEQKDLKGEHFVCKICPGAQEEILFQGGRSIVRVGEGVITPGDRDFSRNGLVLQPGEIVLMPLDPKAAHHQGDRNGRFQRERR